MSDTTSKQILELLQGMQSAQEKADAEFDPMKGRTFIPRMSPAMKRMIVEAIRKGEGKRIKRKVDRIAKRKRQEMLDKGIPEMPLSERQERLLDRLKELGYKI